jgi:hypothetical protein
MTADRPPPPAPGRDALDALAQRLARLADAHPSAPGFGAAAAGTDSRRPAAEGGGAGDRPEPDGGDAGTATGWTPAARQDGHGERPGLRERLARLSASEPGGPAHPGGRAARDGAGHGGAGAGADVVPGAPGSREPYRPWFASPGGTWFGDGPS